MGIDFGVIGAADFNNAIRFYVRRRLKDNRRPPSDQNSKEMTDVSLWVSILGLFGSLISILSLDFTSAAGKRTPGAPPPAKGHPPPTLTSKFNGYDG